MVRRLVEHQIIGLLEQRARQKCARALSTGKFAQGAFEFVFDEAETVERGAHFPLVRKPAVECFLERCPEGLRAGFGGILSEVAQA